MRNLRSGGIGGTTASERLRRFVGSLPPGYIFSCRELLPFASRASVDAFTSYMVRSQYLERLAQGIFRVYDNSNSPVSVEEVAAVKLRAFGREYITLDPADISEMDNQVVVGTSGSTSAFKFKGEKVICKRISPRLQILGESTSGKVLRKLWLKGRVSAKSGDIDSLISYLSRTEKAELPALKSSLPFWLGDMIKLNGTPSKRIIDSSISTKMDIPTNKDSQGKSYEDNIANLDF